LDIKSRNIKYSIWVKLLAVMICIAGGLIIDSGIMNHQYFDYAVQSDNYTESRQKENTYRQMYNWMYDATFKYKGEDFVKSGDILTDYAIEQEKNPIRQTLNEKISNINNEYSNWIRNAENSENFKEVERLTAERDALIDKTKDEYNVRLENVREQLIQNNQDKAVRWYVLSYYIGQ